MPELSVVREHLVRWMEERIRQHSDNLRGWQEPDGYLIPTEPDPEEREITRRELKACIHELEQLKREFSL